MTDPRAERDPANTLVNQTNETLQILCHDLKETTANNARRLLEIEATLKEINKVRDKRGAVCTCMAGTYSLLRRYREASPTWEDDNIVQSPA